MPARQRHRAPTRGLRPWSLAAPEQLGSLGQVVRGCGLCGADAGLARRSGDGGGGESPSEVFAEKTIGQVADHFETIIRGLDKKPAVIGHSFGGLLAQILAGRGLSTVTVAV